MNKYKSREVFQQSLSQTTLENDQKEDQRKLNRIAFTRFEKPLAKGYDLLTNQSINTTEILDASRTKRPTTVWNQVQMSSHSLNSSISLSQLPSAQSVILSSTPSLSDNQVMRKSISTPYLSSRRDNERAQTSIGTDRGKVPSLDLSKTQTPVRTGGF